MKLDTKILSFGPRIRAAASRSGVVSAVAGVTVLLGLATSCDYDSLVMPSSAGDDDSVVLNLKLMSNGTGSDNYDYVVGSDYENYLDIAGGDYQIYFFTNETDNKGNDVFIARFYDDESKLDVETLGDYTWYSMSGTVPKSLWENYEDFKIMVLANWGLGNYPELTPGVSTIDDVCTSTSWGTYSYKTDFELGPGNLIPFYGIQEYKDVKFEAGKITNLDDPINMLRAMAKVEVILDNSDLEFESVVLHHYNETGYCAPAGVYDMADYVTQSNGNWYYIGLGGVDLHLYGGANDTQTDDHNLTMAFTTTPFTVWDTVTEEYIEVNKNTWYCYVPEYSNTVTSDGVTSTASDHAYIQINLPGYTEEELVNYRIYFSNYTDGTTSSYGDYDIGRNVIYRFTVTVQDGTFRVVSRDWEYTFDNDFNVYD